MIVIEVRICFQMVILAKSFNTGICIWSLIYYNTKSYLGGLVCLLHLILCNIIRSISKVLLVQALVFQNGTQGIFPLEILILQPYTCISNHKRPWNVTCSVTDISGPYTSVIIITKVGHTCIILMFLFNTKSYLGGLVIFPFLLSLFNVTARIRE